MILRENAFAILCAILLWSPIAILPQASAQTAETTVTVLVQSPQKFSGKRVHVFASFHTDGLHFSALMEPNCGRLDGTLKTPPPNQPQCATGIVAGDSTTTSDDRGDEALAKGGRGTSDRQITADFTGIFRFVPPGKSRRQLKLEIERAENINVAMKDMKPHRPTS